MDAFKDRILWLNLYSSCLIVYSRLELIVVNEVIYKSDLSMLD